MVDCDYEYEKGLQRVRLTHGDETFVAEREVGSGEPYELLTDEPPPDPVRVRLGELNPENIRSDAPTAEDMTPERLGIDEAHLDAAKELVLADPEMALRAYEEAGDPLDEMAERLLDRAPSVPADEAARIVGEAVGLLGVDTVEEEIG